MFHKAIFSLIVATTLVVAVGASEPSNADSRVRCFRALGCSLDDEIDFQSIRDCCVNDPQGYSYAFIGSEVCTPCIVFGWDVVNTSLSEQGQNYQLKVNIAKGVEQLATNTRIRFNVVDTGAGTAVSGADRDYTLSTNSFDLTLAQAEFVDVIFRSDSVALEPPETVQLRLDIDTALSVEVPTGDGVFCITILDLVIIDNDMLEIQLTEDDRRNGEEMEFIPIGVRKNFRIAVPITFTISPVTLEEARAMNLFPVGVDLPSNNGGRSPIDADFNDFNDTVLTFTFPADEDSESSTDEINLRISITDDPINEALEQDFVAILTVVGDIDQTAFRYGRRSSLCRIIDNDPIRIGFVLSAYTFQEPEFDDPVGVVLATENNVTSEQIFEISLTITNVVPVGSGFEVAELGSDYRGLMTTFDRDFPPFQRELQIQFDLLPDDTPEPTEAFMISSSSNALPFYLSPSSPFYQQTFVVIEDDDVDIIIGFENTTYTVDEGIVSQEVCLRLFVDESIELPFQGDLFVAVQTVAGTADETDYTRIDPFTGVVIISFNNDRRRVCFNLDITDDVLVEGEEQLSIILIEDPFMPPQIMVQFAPNVTRVTIVDTDEAVIGFLNSPYAALEGNGYVTLEVGLISGGVQESVEVALSLSSGSAQDVADFISESTIFTFDRSTTFIRYNVSLVDDDVFEFNEDFQAQLSFVTAVERVSIDPATAQVTIEDDDSVVIGFSPDDYSVVESEGPVDLGVLLTGTLGTYEGEAISVRLSLETSDGTATGSPSLEADYGSLQQELDFSQPGSQIVSVTIFDDSNTEYNETFSASLFNATVMAGGVERDLLPSEAARIVVQPDMASVEILDDDVAVIGFLQQRYSGLENGGAINFTFGVLTGQLSIDVSVDFSTREITNIDNPAQSGLDFGPVINQGFTFNAVTTTAVASVNVIDDDLFEPLEVFNGVLTASALPSNVLLSPSTALGEILEDAAIVIGWNQDVYTSSEDDLMTLLCASIQGDVEIRVEEFSLNVEYFDGSATENSDYTVQATQIGPFSQTSRNVCISVAITNDDLTETDEYFVAMLTPSPSSPPLLVIEPANTTIVITDNDRVTIGVELPNYTVNEGDGSIEVCAVIVSGTLERTLTFTLSTQDGTATSPADFSAVSDDLTFGESTSRACVDIPVEDDIAVENPENFTVVLSGGDPVIDFMPSTSTVTIIDNDVIIVTLDPTPVVSVSETEGSLTMCVQISSPPEGTAIEREPFVVSLSTMEGTAKDPSDYVGVDLSDFGPFSSSMRRSCVDISIVLDSDAEDSETFVVNLEENVDGVAVSSTGGTTTVTIVDSIRRVNDSVIGDPLMTVPIFLEDTSVVTELKENEILNLCYEVHGEADVNFNLVSDQCISVNAHYTQVRPTESQNIISSVFVRTVDSAGTCRNITVNLEGCTASVDGVGLERFSQNGVSVRRYSNRVRIAVPNCQDLDLVMWVICQRRTFWSSQLAPDGTEITFEADMIKFVIARGFNLQETSHGIIGQFWNIPISVAPITVAGSSQKHYTVDVEYPGGAKRSFVGMLWPLTWEYCDEYCLYVGNGQAGPLDEADTGGGPNDPVIEGDYSEYKVDEDFDTSFKYTHFEETMCL